ncbi:hypothetical protein ACJZ2D_013903 [Fusarium nematophilum]
MGVIHLIPSKNGGKFAWVCKGGSDEHNPYLIQVWDGSAKDAVTIQYEQHIRKGVGFALSKNGRYLIAVPKDSPTFTVWDTNRASSEGNQEVCRIDIECGRDRRSPVYLTDTLFASHDGQTIYIEDTEGKRHNEFRVEGNIRALETSRGNSPRLVSITQTAVQAWDVTKSKCLGTFLHEQHHSWGWDQQDISLSEDGSKLALVIAPGELTPAYSIEIWQLDAAVHCIIRFECGGFYKGLALSSDTKQLASWAPEEDRLAIWDATKGTRLHALSGHADTIRYLSFSRDGSRLASGDSSFTILAWELMDVFSPQTNDVKRPRRDRLALSPNGRLYSLEAGGELRIWDNQDESYRAPSEFDTEQGPGRTNIVFSSDGLKLAVARERVVAKRHTIEI